MLQFFMCMIFTVHCSSGLVTTKELNEAMDRAIANGWLPPPAPENAPLPVVRPKNALNDNYLSSI